MLPAVLAPAAVAAGGCRDDRDGAARGPHRWPRRDPRRRQVREFVVRSLAGADLDGRSVCVIVPDATRSCPLPLLLSAVHQALHGRATRVTVLVALGTHAEMADALPAARLPPRRSARTRLRPCSTTSGGSRRPSSTLGDIAAERVAELSEGRLRQPVRRRGSTGPSSSTTSALVVGPGVPARGGRLLRRQQVLLPRRRRPGDHRLLALAGRADHQRRHHRHPRHHAGARPDRPGRGA